jgi:hypothetical protein
MTAQDGKKRLTDVANTEQLLRLIQSIPSKKAELFKMWLRGVNRQNYMQIFRKRVRKKTGSFSHKRF